MTNSKVKSATIYYSGKGPVTIPIEGEKILEAYEQFKQGKANSSVFREGGVSIDLTHVDLIHIESADLFHREDND